MERGNYWLAVWAGIAYNESWARPFPRVGYNGG